MKAAGSHVAVRGVEEDEVGSGKLCKKDILAGMLNHSCV
jgi:hypothetical protein